MEIKLIEFIINEFLTDNDIEISTDTKLISSGIIDSFSLVSLQLYIEREFDKKIPNPKMTIENCDSVKQIINLINQY
jgi:acyl carrier protein